MATAINRGLFLFNALFTMCFYYTRCDLFARYKEENAEENRETFFKIYKVFFNKCGKWMLANRLDKIELADIPETEFNKTTYENVFYHGTFSGRGFSLVNTSELVPWKHRSYAFVRSTYFISACDFSLKNFTLILDNYTMTLNGTRMTGTMSLRSRFNMMGMQVIGRFIPGCSVEVRRVHPQTYQMFDIESTGLDENLGRQLFYPLVNLMAYNFVLQLENAFHSKLAVSIKRFMTEFDFCERLNKSREPIYEYNLMHW